MKEFGSWSELVSIIFREDSQAVTFRPNQSTTYTASRDIQLPPGDADHVLVSATSVAAFTNKTFDADASGNSLTNVDDGNIKAGAAINATKIHDGSVDNTEFGYLNGVTSAIQTQIDGKVSGPGSATDNAVVRFDGTTGKLVKNSTVTMDGSGVVAGATIDGDDNTVQDLPITSIKTVLADANKVLRRDASGVPQSGNTIPNTSALVTIDSSQDLSNKELTAPLIDDYADFNEESAPSTPASGKGRAYVSTDGKFKFVNDDGITKTLGDAGSGEVNTILNPNDAATGWVASGAGITVATTTSSSDLPLEGVFATAIKLTPVSGTDYVRYRWTMPAALKNKKLKLQWDQRPLALYTSGDLKIEVYKNSASDYSGSYTEFALSTDSSGTSSIPAFSGRYTTTYDADDGDYYELRFVRVSGTTALNIVNVINGPGVQPQGAVVSAETLYTPNASVNQGLGTVSNSNLYWSRVGECMHIRGTFRTGTTTAVEGRLAIPDGYTIGTTSAALSLDIVGKFARDNANATTVKQGTILATSGQNYLKFSLDDYTIAVNPVTAQNGNTVFQNNSDVPLTGHIIIPIAEWAGSGTLNVAQNDVEYVANNGSTWDADNTATFSTQVFGPAGTALGGTLTAQRIKRVRFQTPLSANDELFIEFSDDQITWVRPGMGRINNNGINSYGIDTAGATIAGASIARVTGSSTDVDIYFGSKQFMEPDAGGSANWVNTTFWRVKKVRAGAAVGFGTVSENSAGLVPATNANLDSAAATRLGFKSYAHGGSYNGGGAPTITLSAGGGTLSSVVYSQFIPYQMNDGNWRMKFNLQVTLSSVSRTSIQLNVANVTFLSAASQGQAISGWGHLGSVAHHLASALGAGDLYVFHASQTTTDYILSGDVALQSKPSWAY